MQVSLNWSTESELKDFSAQEGAVFDSIPDAEIMNEGACYEDIDAEGSEPKVKGALPQAIQELH